MDEGRHPCVEVGCNNTVLFDDEPYCFTHSPDSGSNVVGYSYKASVTAAQKDCSNKPKCHQCGGSGCWVCDW